MSEHKNKQFTSSQRPNTNDRATWHTYWQALEQAWRTEPEIDSKRQRYLEELIVTRSEERLYPLEGIDLNRTDVEWMIATQVDERGIDLRGASLRNAQLQGLPLQRANFDKAHLEGADLGKSYLEGAIVAEAHLEGANLNNAYLGGANLFKAHLEGSKINKACLKEALLFNAHLEGATLYGTHMEKSYLVAAHLEKADLTETHLEGANLRAAHLEGSDLKCAFFNSETDLRDIILSNKEFGSASLAGVHWGDVDLSVVDWTQIKVLGDERQAKKRKTEEGMLKGIKFRLTDYRTAVRANRQLAVALRNQGLNEEADHFAYRASKLQRVVLRRQRKFGSYLFFGFLDLIAGYGYRPWRSILWYLIVICGFATTYFVFGHLPLLPDAFVFSLMSFHGRGFFPSLSSETNLHNPLVILAAAEAVIGLFIEISFIATFTQRFFGK